MEEATLNIEGEESIREEATLTAGETAMPDGASLGTGSETPEAGVSSDITGENELREETREPRDNIDHHEDHTFQNNVTIAGTLRTKRWVHPHGCMFRTEDKLREEYPIPESGMWAFVGTKFPGEIWICRQRGLWEKSETIDGDKYDREELEGTLKGDFLSKLRDDRTPYGLSVGGVLTAEDVLTSKDFLAGVLGWRIDRRGNGELESLKVRSFMEIAELITNRLTAIEGDTLLTEADTIETVTDNGDGTYTLRLHEKWEGYFTAQIEHNILKGIYNDITPGLTPGQGQQTVNNATYFTSWMNVLDVDAANNTLVVTLYPDSETPAGRNFAPRGMMKVARWGNSGDSENPRYAQRQQCLYFSSTEGRIMKLYRVTKPIPDMGMVAMTVGTLPDFIHQLDPSIPLNEEGGYFSTLVAQRFVQLDHQGRPMPTTIDRGPWKEGEKYYDGTVPNDNGVYERSLAWHAGHGWLCNSTGIADATNAPSWHSTWWTHAVGDKALHLEFEQVDSIVEPENPETPLSLRATYMGEDVTGSMAIYFDWTRRSWRNGTEDTASDAIWNADNRNAGPSKTLTASDMNFQFGAPPEKLVITVTATLHDPSNPNLQPEAAQIYMI